MQDLQALTVEDKELLEKLHIPVGKSKLRKGLEHAFFASIQGNSLFMSFLLSIMRTPILKQIVPAAFYVAFSLEALIWTLLAAGFAAESNKNLPKIAALGIQTLAVIGVGFAVFGAALIGVTTGPIIFAGVIGLSVLRAIYNTVEAIYKRYWLGEAKTQKQIDTETHTIKWSAAGVATTLLIGAAILTCLVFAPYVALNIGIAVSVLAAVGVLVVSRHAIITYYNRHKTPADMEEMVDFTNDDKIDGSKNQNEDEKTVEKGLLDDDDNGDVQLNAQGIATVEKLLNNFYVHLRDHHLMKVTKFFNEGYVHPTRPVARDEDKQERSVFDKDENKRAALNFLEEFISKFDHILDSKFQGQGKNQYKTFAIDGVEFQFRNTTELTHKIDEHIIDKYPGAFQSANTGFWDRPEYGKVQSRFREAYQILIASEKIAQNGSASVQELKDKFTAAKDAHGTGVTNLRSAQRNHVTNEVMKKSGRG